ncbi:TetR/AcrR family transcriptional regulator [Rhodococcus sp. NPDC058505]|uniref:TetR/AcrR family transcriptional regulator n=1 Tax=unclassified Rhodococcus (in: high G+C Gram-positive bacteria) TaxID=192944 RepID=UPI003663EE71
MARGDVVRSYGGVSADDRRADRRRKLVGAARRSWGHAGLGEVTVRGVCAAAGLQPRYFYEQFANRDALLVAVADEVRGELFATLVDSSRDADGTLEDKLRAALSAFLGAIAADPDLHRIMRTDLAGIPGLENRRVDSLNIVADLILQYGSGIPGFGTPGGADPRRFARFVAGGVNHLVENWLVHPDESPEELADVCTRLCLGFAGRPGRPLSGSGVADPARAPSR